MKILSRNGLVIVIAILMLPLTVIAGDDRLYPPSDYIHTKLQQNDIVFLGTRHKQPQILTFIAELIPSLKGRGVTHIGMEIRSDQQEMIDTFMETGKGLENIQFHIQVDHPDYRQLFDVMRESGGPIPVAIDLPSSMYKGTVSRDEWMARSLLIVLNRNPSAKILVIVGSFHTLTYIQHP